MIQQREQNPDVNTYHPDVDPAEGHGDGPNDDSTDVERGKDDSIPIPPDSTPAAPIEEPPSSDRAPIGDVDDSPMRIA